MLLFFMFLVSQTAGFLVLSPEGDAEDLPPHLSPLKVHRHDLKRELPYGHSDFITMVKDNNLIVDKTAWIAEALTGRKLKLITRPRRFGKSTNLSMLRAFLTKDQNIESLDLFAGFTIGNDTKFEGIRREHQHKYAVFHFSFLHCGPASTASDVQYKLTACIRGILTDYFDLYHRHFQPRVEEHLASIVNGHGNFTDVLQGFKRMIRVLRDSGYKTAILIDEYDAPFQNAIEKKISTSDAGKNFVFGELYQKTVDMMREFYIFFFRGGLDFFPDWGVIIGISYVAKNSIFSDLTNFKAYTTLKDDKFGPYFGFMEHEVKWLIDSSETNLSYKEFQEWYDGYHFGNYVIFNPFAVVSAFEDGEFDVYWAKSGSLEIVRYLIKYTGRYGMQDLYFLLSGRSLRKVIHEDLIFKDLLKTEESYWTLLTNAGYVDGTKLDVQSSEIRTLYALRIPNKELKVYLTTNFKSELEGAKKEADSFVYRVHNLQNHTSEFEQNLFDRFNTRTPYYMLHENANLDTLVNVFESLFVNFEFDYRSLGTLNMNGTPVYQIVFIKQYTAHVFNIAQMDVTSSYNASHDTDQLLQLPLIKENSSVIEKRSISRLCKASIIIFKHVGKVIGREVYSFAVKAAINEGIEFIRDHVLPHIHG